MTDSETAAWQVYLGLVTQCWQGRVDEVVVQLTAACQSRGLDLEQRISDDDPCKPLADAVRYGQRNAGKLIKKSRQFDDLIAGSALSGSGQALFAQSFQAYLMNTWWCDTVTGKEWFSVWEGTCLFHSTVDVEYNVALFYLVFWPRLLGLSLHEWTGHLKANTRGPGWYLDHDMGGGILANGSQYGHIMGVEEAANFLLLLLAHVRFNGDVGILQEQGIRQAATDLVEYQPNSEKK